MFVLNHWIPIVLINKKMIQKSQQDGNLVQNKINVYHLKLVNCVKIKMFSRVKQLVIPFVQVI